MGRTFRVFKLSAAMSAALVVLAVAAGGAVAAPTSHAEALQQGDPAATAPVFSESADGAVYQGKPVSAATIAAKELSCFAVDVGPSRCYDSPAALEAAELGLHVGKTDLQSGPHTNSVSHDCSIWAILFIFTGADMSGSSAAFAEIGRWANLNSVVNNEGSSFAMGDRPGHLAENQGGGGFWYPGATDTCANESNLNLNGSGWNNRISSRYRS
jgi:hypothetical protein